MTPIYVIAIGGVLVYSLLLFQIAVGMRWIKFKGAKHWRIHKVNAWVIVGLATGHGLAALMYIGIIPGWPF